MSDRPTQSPSGGSLGVRVRGLRKQNEMTLAEVSAATGISVSALSKIENDQTSPTFSNLMRLAEGLNISLGTLVTLGDEDPGRAARMTVTRSDEARFRTTPGYDIWPLCGDIQHKRMTPMIERVRNRDLGGDDGMLSHSGEEFVHVLQGAVEVHTEHYEPVRLEVGDSLYLDSQMAHGYVSVSPEDAEILMVWLSPSRFTSSQVTRLVEELRGRKDQSVASISEHSSSGETG